MKVKSPGASGSLGYDTGGEHVSEIAFAQMA
jgi:hypothetical protein